MFSWRPLPPGAPFALGLKTFEDLNEPLLLAGAEIAAGLER